MTAQTGFIPCIDFSERVILEIRTHVDPSYQRGDRRRLNKTREPEIRSEWSERFTMMRHDGLPSQGTCWHCRRPATVLERAHIIPACHGGTDHPGNLWMLCKACHKETETHDVWYKVHALVDPHGSTPDENMMTNTHYYRFLSCIEYAFIKGRYKGILKGLVRLEEPEDQVSMLDDEAITIFALFMSRIQQQDNPYAHAVLMKWCNRVNDAIATGPQRRGLLFDT